MKEMAYDNVNLQTLLAHTLREKADSYTLKELLHHYPTMLQLLNATEEELQQITGIGPTKARQIRSIIELSRLLSAPTKDERYVIRSPKDAFNLLKGELTPLTQEHFIVIGLNTKNHVLFTHTVTIGTLNSSLVHPREVFRPLIKKSACSCIVAHNHPSGDSTPSAEDINVTKRLVQAGEIIGIELLDHIIIGLDEFTSLKEKGWL